MISSVPLPIPYTSLLNGRLLTIIVDTPPAMNIQSTVEFELLIHDPLDGQKTFSRILKSDLNPKLGITLSYALLPNRNHTIIFEHIVPSIGYSQVGELIPPSKFSSKKFFIRRKNFRSLVLNDTYPFAVTDLRVKEEFHMITVQWRDTHEWYDAIEYIISCNNNGIYLINVGRNTSGVCEQTTLSDTTTISVLTRVAIPNYQYDRIGIAKLDGIK